MRTLTVLIFAVLVIGCGSVSKYQTLEQPTDKMLTVGLGDPVLRLENSQSLPNVVGKADLFGRRTNTGSSQITFLGVERDGTIVLARRDIEILSNETTMSRSRNPAALGASQGSATTTITPTATGAVARTSADAQHVAVGPTHDYHIVIPPDVIPIRIPPGMTFVPLAGYQLEIIEATAVSISYRIRPPQ